MDSYILVLITGVVSIASMYIQSRIGDGRQKTRRAQEADQRHDDREHEAKERQRRLVQSIRFEGVEALQQAMSAVIDIRTAMRAALARGEKLDAEGFRASEISMFRALVAMKAIKAIDVHNLIAQISRHVHDLFSELDVEKFDAISLNLLDALAELESEITRIKLGLAAEEESWSVVTSKES